MVDASGTWSAPNPLGGDGLPALGERAAADRIAYRVPDLDDPAVRARYAGKRIAVAGSRALRADRAGRLRRARRARARARRSTGCCAAAAVGDTFGGGDADQLPARGALGQRAAGRPWRRATSARSPASAPPRSTAGRTGRLVLEAVDGRRLDPVDEVVVLTGFRPDLSFLSEVRLDLDPVLQAPRALAPLIDPNVHSCGTVYPHGAASSPSPSRASTWSG